MTYFWTFGGDKNLQGMSKIAFLSGISSNSNVHNIKLPENILKCHLVH